MALKSCVLENSTALCFNAHIWGRLPELNWLPVFSDFILYTLGLASTPLIRNNDLRGEVQ